MRLYLMRKCVRCKKELDDSCFSINPKTNDYCLYCNNCLKSRKEYRESNKDKIKEYSKEYYESNKDKIKEYYKEYNKKYYESNKDKIKEYRESNKDKIKEYNKEYSKEYYESNKDKIKEYSKEYYESNKDKRKEYSKEYRKKLALYDVYVHKFNENVRKDKDGNLLVKCKYCNKWFTPTNESVLRYLRFDDGTNNLYCSEACKKSCPSYGVKKYERGFRRNTSREVQPELRKLVLERDNWTCQRCGKSKNDDIELVLHCHHIEPVKRNPVESADIDNCITLCKECHKEVHRIKGCRYTDLANCTREQK